MADILLNEETNEVEGNQNNARVAMLERMNDVLDASRADELRNVHDDDTTSEFVAEPVEGLEEETLSPSVEETTPPVEEPAPQVVAPQTFRVRVNGRDIEMTQEEVLARASKVEAADVYLAEAARIRREAEQKFQQPTTPQASAKEHPIEDERALIRAIQMGSEEEALAALRKLNQPTSPSFNVDDLARTVDERLTFKQSVERFKSEFSDIATDPNMLALALQRDKDLLAQGDHRGYWDRYEEIGKSLRNYKFSVVQSALTAMAPPPATPQTDKQTRKAAAPSTPQASSKKSEAQRVEDDREESPAEVIANMAKSRGGPQWARA